MRLTIKIDIWHSCKSVRELQSSLAETADTVYTKLLPGCLAALKHRGNESLLEKDLNDILDGVRQKTCGRVQQKLQTNIKMIF